MAQKKKNSSSFPYGLVILIVLVIVGIAAFFLYQSYSAKRTLQHSTEQTTQTEQAPPAQPTPPVAQTTKAVPPADKTTVKEPQVAPVQKEKPPQAPPAELPPLLEIPLCGATKAQHSAADHELRTLSAFSLCYRESYEQAEWVAYELTAEELTKNSSRTDNFRADPGISTQSATPDDYRGSGYDRGHLAPAGDMSFSAEAMSESFYMSNMSPQTPGFNRGVWKNLETAVRDWAAYFGSVYVVSGPILDKETYPSIGLNKVAVPEEYYKVLLAKKDGVFFAIAFILPNEKSDKGFEYYATSIDEVEKRTGIDFFHLLPDDIEDKVEAISDYAAWQPK